MIRLSGVVEIIQMTTDTFRGGVRKFIRKMALGAVLNVMTQSEREKVMIDEPVIPSGGEKIVTIQAILRRITYFLVVWCSSIQKIVHVAGHTFVTESVEPQIGIRTVTVNAAQVAVIANQWEPVGFVQFRNIVNQPVLRRMTSHAIITYRHVMDIIMARNALGGSFIKNHGNMARFTIRLEVNTLQLETPLTMIIMKGINIYRPTIRVVTNAAIYLEVVSMW